MHSVNTTVSLPLQWYRYPHVGLEDYVDNEPNTESLEGSFSEDEDDADNVAV